jgi:head-tail adaptor
MRSGRLKERVRVERRGTTDDGRGNRRGDFAPLFSGQKLPAEVRPGSRRSDSVIAAKLTGVNVYEVRVRQDSLSRQITADDRLVWLRPWGDVVLNIRGNPVDPDGRRQDLLMTCEDAVAT